MKLCRSFPLVYLLGLFMYSGAAEYKLSGKVIDRSGSPIEGAKITLLSTDQTITSSNDGTFEFEISAVHKYTNRIKSHFKIYNRKLFLHVTDLQDVLVDLFDLNGRKISVLQNGKLNPGFYQFPIPAMIGNQILLLRLKVGPINQVYKLIGNSNVSLLKQLSSSVNRSVSANVSVSDTLKVTHPNYDDIKVVINSYQQPLTVQMLHNKLSFELLNTIKIGDTLYNSSNHLRVSFNSIKDYRCLCSDCEQQEIINLFLTFCIDTVSYPFQFSAPIHNDTTIEGYKLVLTKVDPPCPPNDEDAQNYSISFGIAKADSFRKIVFLNHTRFQRFKFDHDSCINVPCLPQVTFNFNDDKILSGAVPEINDATKLIFGDGLYVNFNGTDIGAQNFLTCSELLPWNDNPDISVDSIGSDGTLWIKWRNQNLTLKPGDRKISTQDKIDSSSLCIININTTDTLINHGILYPWQIQRNE